MTCFRKYIFLQLLGPIVFLQMHKLTSPKNVKHLQIILLFSVIFKIIMVFELFETIISK